MTGRALAALCVALGGLLASGCYSVPAWQMRQAQLRNLQLYRQNQSLASRMGQSDQAASQMAAERQQLEAQLAIANQRLDNLNTERAALHDRYRHLLASNPLPGSATERFKELAGKYPEFEFDPQTGVSKFNADLLFALGSDEVRSDADGLLREFAKIMNEPDARQFNILIAGHTDDLEIKRAGTKARHPTNWELSAHRGTAVIHRLKTCGLAEDRMGVAGYSMFQPVVPNNNDANRQKNRRVEIYVLAPDARIASGF